ncbi:unnamed protein product [Ceutorhynchus assimilis]|uniref:Transcriptional regulator ATRX n=1 Tax=Ceutorhynchus assimilis TaxID=467358 RepID=A0A9P0DHN0_9CUCU|nr:unnamed protein product [Ceutorhynchus assimilis]
MSDIPDIEELLQNLNKTLTSLDQFGNIDTFIDKLDAKNRKQLKKVKNVVWDINSKVGNIKDKVSKAYKRVKVRIGSESNEPTTIEDGSDKEVDSLVSNGGLEASIEEADRYSPVIRRKSRRAKKSSKVADNEDESKDKEEDSDDSEIQTNGENSEDEPLAKINKESEQPTENEKSISDESIVESTPDKSHNKKLLMTLRKSQDKTVHEIIESSMGTDLDDNVERAIEEPSGEHSKIHEHKNQTSADDNEEDSSIDTGEKRDKDDSNMSDSEKKLDEDKEEENSTIRDSGKSKINEDREEEESDSDSEKNKDEVEQNKQEEEPDLDMGKSKANKKKKNKDKKSDDSNNSIKKTKNNTDEEPEKVHTDIEEPEKNLVESGKSNKEIQNFSMPKIKLIDISKLLDPNAKPLVMTPTPSKHQKSVTFDSSVIILSSSDEDTPKKSPIGKENDVTPLKSALRKTTSKSKIIELSDSDSKENDVKKKRKKLYSDESENEDSRRSRRLQGRNRDVKSKFTKLRKAREEKLKESAKDARRSKRNLGRKKKELLEESSLSEDDDDDSDVELVEKSSKKRTWSSRSKKAEIKEANINDPKFKLPVFIRLPKFPTEDLQELYKNKKEILEIKKLCKINLSTNRKQKEIEEEETSTDDAQEKRIKLTLKIGKKNLEKEKNNSDDEQSSTEDNDNVEKDDDVDMLDLVRDSESQNAREISQNAAEMDGLATCLDQIKDSDEEMSTSKEAAESDEETSEKDKNNDKSSDKEQAKEKDEETKVNGMLSGSDEESDKDKEANEKIEKSKNDEDSPEEEESRKKKKTKKKMKDNEKNDTDEDAHSSDDSDKGKNKVTIESSSDEDAPQLKAGSKSDSKKRSKKKVISDSDSSDCDRNADSNLNSTKSNNSSSSSSSNSDNEKSEEETQSKSRKRIKKLKDSSSSDEEDKSTRKALRKMIDKDSLSETTLKAEAEEKARKARILEKQNKYNKIFELKADAVVDKVVLDFDEKTNKPLLSVHKKLVKHLKPHQVLGIKFMWDACFESLDRASKTAGSGCILAHCMGLGKTLQVIALAHTLLMNQEKTKVERIMVVCPVNTVINWKNEFRKWMPKTDDFDIYELVSCKTSSVNQERNYIIKCWHDDGGVLIIGYNMFRTLSNPDNKTLSKKLRQSLQTGLVDPGPDLVICDEGHLLKNEKTNLSIAMNRIKTARRIVLTGTPLQNNLREYWCMVQFIKPNLLGTYKEYLNRFVNPITNGQYTDSTQHDIMVMRRRSHVLHKLLDGVVQRQDYEVLAPYLPPKYEYIIFLKLTDVQIKLYKHYIENLARQNDGSNKTSFLFADFQQLQRICTHPRVLLDKSNEDRDKKEKNGDESEESEGSIADFIDDDSESAESTPDESSNSDSDGSNASANSHKKKKKEKKSGKRAGQKTRFTRAQAAQKRDAGEVVSISDTELDDRIFRRKEWWEEYIPIDELDNINHSSKMFLLFQLLKECEEIGDKILVFSQSLYTLNSIEYFLAKIDEATQNGEPEKVGGHSGSWAIGLDYFRLDGSSSCENRAGWCDEFNNPNNTRARLFLISTKAGGLGINLVAANRVIIFDVSWNPSHDIQSIYRVYRFGQTKPSYIYRFVTHGAMEMKIYERQVTKQAISKRVIDEQQIDRHYSQNDIQELYKTDLEPEEERPIPRVPKDVLLGEMLQKYDKTIYKYHEHQTLLENKQDEELNEEERKAAWDEFENEKVIRKTAVTIGSTNLGAINTNAFNIHPNLLQAALRNIIRKENPTWSEIQITGVLPALVTQLQLQMSEQDYRLFTRVNQEVQMMQTLQYQQAYFKQLQMQQQQHQQLQQQQQQQQKLLKQPKQQKRTPVNPYLITPEELQLLKMGQDVTQHFSGVPEQARAGGSGVKPVASKSNRAFAPAASGSSSTAATSAADKSNDIIELND